MAKLDPYVVLGVSKSATKNEARKKYLEKMRFHPDHAPDHLKEEYEEMTKKVNWAWGTNKKEIRSNASSPF